MATAAAKLCDHSWINSGWFYMSLEVTIGCFQVKGATQYNCRLNLTTVPNPFKNEHTAFHMQWIRNLTIHPRTCLIHSHRNKQKPTRVALPLRGVTFNTYKQTHTHTHKMMMMKKKINVRGNQFFTSFQCRSIKCLPNYNHTIPNSRARWENWKPQTRYRL